MRAHIIENGIVTNTIEVESLDFLPNLIEAVEGGIGWYYDGTTFSPPPRWSDLSSGKAELHALINAKRDTLEEAGFSYLSKIFDSDSRSVQRINTAVQAAQAANAAGQSFSIDWTCADNSIITLDTQGILAIPAALASYANAIHQYARDLKSTVDAATTSEDLDSIDIEAGWPI